MINENFISRVIQVLVEMRLDEGIVKARNKARKNTNSIGLGASHIAKWGSNDYVGGESKPPGDKIEDFKRSGRNLSKSSSNVTNPTSNLNHAGRFRRSGDKGAAKLFLSGSKYEKKRNLP